MKVPGHTLQYAELGRCIGLECTCGKRFAELEVMDGQRPSWHAVWLEGRAAAVAHLREHAGTPEALKEAVAGSFAQSAPAGAALCAVPQVQTAAREYARTAEIKHVKA